MGSHAITGVGTCGARPAHVQRWLLTQLVRKDLSNWVRKTRNYIVTIKKVIKTTRRERATGTPHINMVAMRPNHPEETCSPRKVPPSFCGHITSSLSGRSYFNRQVRGKWERLVPIVYKRTSLGDVIPHIRKQACLRTWKRLDAIRTCDNSYAARSHVDVIELHPGRALSTSLYLH